jgi:tRNA-dihydrouridine synthase
MKYYFAPMEGVTGYLYRNAHQEMFSGIDKYFTPFLSPNQNRCFTPRELRDITPENNVKIPLVPQILTNNAEYFLKTADALLELGYRELNLNLGCPSGTVVAKGKGAGFLEDTDQLDAFLEKILKKTEEKRISISVKTRIGVDSGEEFTDLLAVYNRYPLKELIIHPRVRSDYYKNRPNWRICGEALRESKNPVCYNGDIFSVSDYEKLKTCFPELDRLMCGRGMLKNPALIRMISGGKDLEREELKEFHDRIYRDYRMLFAPDERSVLFKMKELWGYMAELFADGKKEWKKIKKAQHFRDYERAVFAMFQKPLSL